MEKKMICQNDKCKNQATHAKQSLERKTNPEFIFDYFCKECYEKEDYDDVR
jgi:hypothetical protein